MPCRIHRNLLADIGLWLFWLAPIVGALIGAVICRTIESER
jgi:glycerol uptake facilitator-like aquaporin